MDIDEVIQLAAEAKAAELIKQIEAGDITYEQCIKNLWGSEA